MKSKNIFIGAISLVLMSIMACNSSGTNSASDSTRSSTDTTSTSTTPRDTSSMKADTANKDTSLKK